MVTTTTTPPNFAVLFLYGYKREGPGGIAFFDYVMFEPFFELFFEITFQCRVNGTVTHVDWVMGTSFNMVFD